MQYKALPTLAEVGSLHGIVQAILQRDGQWHHNSWQFERMLQILDEASELPFTKYVDKQSEETKGCHGSGRA